MYFACVLHMFIQTYIIHIKFIWNTYKSSTYVLHVYISTYILHMKNIHEIHIKISYEIHMKITYEIHIFSEIYNYNRLLKLTESLLNSVQIRFRCHQIALFFQNFLGGGSRTPTNGRGKLPIHAKAISLYNYI